MHELALPLFRLEPEESVADAEKASRSTSTTLHVRLLLADYNELRSAAIGKEVEATLSKQLGRGGKDGLAVAAARREALWSEVEEEVQRHEAELEASRCLPSLAAWRPCAPRRLASTCRSASPQTVGRQAESGDLDRLHSAPPAPALALPSPVLQVVHVPVVAGTASPARRQAAEAQRSLYRMLENGIEQNIGWEQDLARISQALAEAAAEKQGGFMPGPNYGGGSGVSGGGAAARRGAPGGILANQAELTAGQKAHYGRLQSELQRLSSANAQLQARADRIATRGAEGRGARRVAWRGGAAGRACVARDQLAIWWWQAQLERGKGELAVVNQQLTGAKFVHNVYAGRVKRMVHERRELSGQLSAMEQASSPSSPLDLPLTSADLA